MSSLRLVAATIFIAMSLMIGFLGVRLTNASLPGDALFPLKTKLEYARINLAGDSALQAELYLKSADRRLSEMQSLLDGERYTDLTLASSEFARNIQLASEVIHNLSQVDPVQRSALNRKTIILLRGYDEILSHNLMSIPENIQPVVEKSTFAPQPASIPESDNFSGPQAGTPETRVTILPTMTPLAIKLSTSTPMSLSTLPAASSVLQDEDVNCQPGFSGFHDC